MVTLVKRQVLEGDDGRGSGSQKAILPSLGLIVSWLLAITNNITPAVKKETQGRLHKLKIA